MEMIFRESEHFTVLNLLSFSLFPADSNCSRGVTKSHAAYH